MVEPAPGLLSTITGCLKITDIFSATMRAIKSEPPPGGNPTTILSGLFGKVCAPAGAITETAASKNAVISAVRVKRTSF